MKRQRSSGGFTMMELLIVVAILGILSSVSVIAVVNYQKSAVRLEENNIAKEIFVAAQNHLTLARNEGYLGVSEADYGEPDTGEAGKGVYYYVVQRGLASSVMFDLMLPFGSMEEVVRTSGNYLIRYQPASGLVLDVFYCKPDSERYGRSLSVDDYGSLMAARNAAGSSRTANLAMSDGTVVGWYGGQKAEDIRAESTMKYESPTLKINNGERLTAEVALLVSEKMGDADSLTLKLIVDGRDSGAKKAFVLKAGADHETNLAEDAARIAGSEETTVLTDGGTTETVTKYSYTVTLDDITGAGLRFFEMTASDGAFIPGEDIRIAAIAYNNSELNAIAYSDLEVTNSLFEKIEAEGGGNVAYINNPRHLENLDEQVSGFQCSDAYPAGSARTATWTLNRVRLSSDLDWSAFDPAFVPDPDDATKAPSSANVSVCYGPAAAASETDKGYYKPVNTKLALAYDGQKHSISGIKARTEGNAGLFGALASGSDVRNLALIDFDIEASGEAGNAGALAGAAAGSTVSNVAAYNTVEKDSKVNPTIRTAGDAGACSAGGLIGALNGGTVEKSAAALIVNSVRGNAGGLIGAASGTVTVRECFSGGHTKHDDLGHTYSPDDFNVTAAGFAGGLIGDAGSAAISLSYSTCSAKGNQAGGFVGQGSGSATDCYATGLVVYDGVDLTTRGAFACKFTGTLTRCQYYEIVNEYTTAEGTVDYLTPLARATDADTGLSAGVKPLDEDFAVDRTVYNDFVGAETDWRSTNVYDASLTRYYGAGRFSLKTIKQLGATDLIETASDTDPYTDYVVTHYGDWPAPEIFVFNVAG